MPSLETRVARQRDILMARGAGIRLHAGRTHARLRHPAILIPVFLAGMLVARGAPVLFRVLPRLTSRLRNITEELGKFDATVKQFVSMVLVLQRPSGGEVDDTPDMQFNPEQKDTGRHPPPT